MLTANGVRCNKKRKHRMQYRGSVQYFVSIQTTFCVFVQVSIKELGSNSWMEINRQQGECSFLFSLTPTKLQLTFSIISSLYSVQPVPGCRSVQMSEESERAKKRRKERERGRLNTANSTSSLDVETLISTECRMASNPYKPCMPFPPVHRGSCYCRPQSPRVYRGKCFIVLSGAKCKEEACSTRHIFQFNPKLKLFQIVRLLVKGVAVTLKFKKSHLGVQLVTKLPLNYVHVSKKCVQRRLIIQLIYSTS